MSDYSIGQLARAAGVPVSTVRFYERAALLKPDARTGSNYRHYSQPALDRLRFIRLAQATGFSLEGVRELLGLTQSEGSPCDDLAALTRKRLADVRLRIKELRSLEKVLARSLEDCCTGQAPDLCGEISRLQGCSGLPAVAPVQLVSVRLSKKSAGRA